MITQKEYKKHNRRWWIGKEVRVLTRIENRRPEDVGAIKGPPPPGPPAKAGSQEESGIKAVWPEVLTDDFCGESLPNKETLAKLHAELENRLVGSSRAAELDAGESPGDPPGF